MTEAETIGDKTEYRDDKGRFTEGNPGGPGRPKGKTIKERVREWLEEHPESMDDFVQHFVEKNRELAWQMLEGRPQQDITSGGEKIEPSPIYAGLSTKKVPGHDGDQADIQDQAED